MFNLLTKIIKILFNKNIIFIKGIRFRLKGKINGKMRKNKIEFSLGKLPLSKFNDYLTFNFLTKLTVFGSLSLKLWIIYD